MTRWTARKNMSMDKVQDQLTENAATEALNMSGAVAVIEDNNMVVSPGTERPRMEATINVFAENVMMGDHNVMKIAGTERPTIEDIRERVSRKIDKTCGQLQVMALQTDRISDEQFVRRELPLADYYVNLRVLQTLDVNKSMEGELATLQRGLCSRDVSINEEGLFKDGFNHCFIRGVAGVGKTTFMRNLALKCARGHLYEKLIPLYVECRAVRDGESIESYIKRRYFNDGSILTELKCILLIDGLDENPGLLEHSAEFLKEHFVVLSGRPYVEHIAEHIAKRCELNWKRVEIVGFADSEVEKYVNYFCNGNKEVEQRIKGSFESSQRLLDLATVPFFLSNICMLLSTGDTVAVSKVTSLYTHIFFYFWLKHLMKKGDEWVYETLGDRENVEFLKWIAKICWELLLNKRVIFRMEDFKDVEIFKKKHPSLFLAFIDEKKSHKGSRFQFRHLTFMEFLASLHLYLIMDVDTIEMLIKRKSFVILQFLCGFRAAEEDQRRGIESEEWQLTSQLIIALRKRQRENTEDGIAFKSEPEEEVLIGKEEIIISIVENLEEDLVTAAVHKQQLAIRSFLESFSYSAKSELLESILGRIIRIGSTSVYAELFLSQVDLPFVSFIFDNNIDLINLHLTIQDTSFSIADAVRVTLLKNLLSFKDVVFYSCDFEDISWEAGKCRRPIGNNVPSLRRLRFNACSFKSTSHQYLFELIRLIEYVTLWNISMKDGEWRSLFEAITNNVEERTLKKCDLTGCNLSEGMKEKFRNVVGLDVIIRN